MKLLVPTGQIIGEKIIYVDSPESHRKIDLLVAELAVEKSKPARVVEKIIEKFVEVKVDDPELLKRLNEQYRENAELRKHQLAPRTVEVEKVKEVEVERLVNVRHIKIELAIGAASSLVGFLIGRF